MSEIKLQTKINSFLEVQKSLQEIEKQLNVLSKSLSSKAESEVSDTEGKSGDIKTTRNVDGSYSFEIRTDSGWKTPVLGESSIKFKDKPASISKPTILSIDEMEAEDTTKGDVKAKKNIFDEKADKFVLPRPDYESGWFLVEEDKQYVTGATDGVAPDTSSFYDDASEVVGIPALGFSLKSPPTYYQILIAPPKVTTFDEAMTSGILILQHAIHERYPGATSSSNWFQNGFFTYMTSPEHICFSTAQGHLFNWASPDGDTANADGAGGLRVTSWTSDWYQAFTATGTSADTASVNFRIWK